uniref:Calpain catalytic domain-containing protein n=1 Tax=Caenorhabditis japonica TaxID=281687 RepID=A0A8R1I4C6_CAEJA
MYCTLINETHVYLCQGCGSQKPTEKKAKSTGSFVSKMITNTVRDVASVIADMMPVNNRKPSHNIVRVHDLRAPLPNGPFVNGDQANQPSTSSSSFYVDHSQPTPLNRYENVVDDPEVFNTESEDAHGQMCSEITSQLKRDAQTKSDIICNDIVKYCQLSNTPFVDDQFLPNKKFIGTLHFTKNGVKRLEEPDFLHWLRPSQMFTKDGRCHPWTVFNNPRPSDIEQGNLVGDCWLMSAMALIAERPDVLDEIVPRKEYSHYGVYQIKLCVEGEWKVIIVDDLFPCYRNTNSMAMAVGRRNQLWVPLIEKALAKVFGSYSKLHGASLAQGLTILTGASCVNYTCPPQPRTVDDVDTFWVQLVSSKESGFLMCCHCGALEDPIAEAEFKTMGLLTNHAYSILDVIHESGHRLLRIRNPWGQFVWNGKWSDGWPGWPPHMKQRLVHKRSDETGTFWMDLEDFISRFASVTVCKLRPEWSELRVKQMVGESRISNSLKIIITDTCEASFMVFQTKSSAKFANNEMSDLMLCIHKITPEGRIGDLMAMSSRLADNHFTIDEFFLPPGEYTVVCQSLRAHQTHRKGKVNIVVHTRIPIFAEFVPLTSRNIVESLEQMVIRIGEVVNSVESGVVIRTMTQNIRGMIIMVENWHNNKYLHVGVDCSESMNIQSSRGMLHVYDVIPPFHRQVLIVLTTIDDSAMYKVSNSLKTLANRHQYLLPQMWYEASIAAPKSQHYPSLAPNSQLHKPWPIL